MKAIPIPSSLLLMRVRTSGIHPHITSRRASSTTSRRCLTTSTTAPSTPTPNPPMPLKGIRVLDMTRVLAGPYCTQILGDLGADVIKVEHPTRGDDTRAWGPPYAKHVRGTDVDGPGESAYFLSVNRNKRSLGVLFTEPDGQRVLHRLVEQADVLVENYLPGTLKKYGLDYETLAAINPSLIYASITGYGQTGPWSSRAGYDVMVEAELGLMHITGARDGPPVKVGVAVTDLTTGLYTSNAILASLLSRSSTSSPERPKGLGTHIDACLADCQVATLTNIATSALISGQPDSGRWGTEHPSIVPYQAFPCKPSSPHTTISTSTSPPPPPQSQSQQHQQGSGEDQILLGGGNDRLFTILSATLGHPEWTRDPRFSTNAARVAHRGDLTALISTETRKETLRHWLAVFAHSGLPHAAVNDIQTTLQHPVVQARGMVGEFEHATCGSMRHVASPVVFSPPDAAAGSASSVVNGGGGGGGMGTGRPTVRRPPPGLGEHTDEILTAAAAAAAAPQAADSTTEPIWGLDLSDADVASLRERGVVS